MQEQVTLLYTRNRSHPVSFLIRWAMPRSRFALGLSSHVIVLARGRYFEATMGAGVREVEEAVALKGQIIVRRREHSVPDLDAGIAWARLQLCTYTAQPASWVPAWACGVYCAAQLLMHNNYDWGGALGLGLAPGRNWADEEDWFCYEFAGGFMRACGRQLFDELSHVGETALLAINP
ncbi:hypothetical protein ACHAC9_22390 [Massilia sp. CMS3.1]|uniref:hypothetical protein n=1 Tax=Massilia sp. CMS3.1 TaxID=3373083 RepID=UPI003EE81541